MPPRLKLAVEWLLDLIEWLFDLLRRWKDHITSSLIAAVVVLLEHLPDNKGEAHPMIWDYIKWWAYIAFLYAAFQQWRTSRKELGNLLACNKDLVARLEVLDKRANSAEGTIEDLKSQLAACKAVLSDYEKRRETKQRQILKDCMRQIQEKRTPRLAVFLAKADELEHNEDLVSICSEILYQTKQHPFWAPVRTDIIPEPQLPDFNGYIRPQEDWLPFLQRMRISPTPIRNDSDFESFRWFDCRYDEIPNI